jgi:hypothetical protein
VLLAPQRMLRADGSVVDTQFSETNTGISWSHPTGKALITPNPATGQLFWRGLDNLSDRLDITFTNGTIAAAYHPSGTRIAAIGTGITDGRAGVFIASNRGKEAQRVDTPAEGKPTDLGFDMSGSSLVFTHRLSDGASRVFRYLLGSGDRLTLATTSATPGNLTISTVDEGDVAWVERRSGEPSVVFVLIGLDAVDPVPVSLPEGFEGTPLGWLPNHRLALAVRPAGDTGRDFDVWVWSPEGSVPIISGASAAGARVLHGPWSQPPGTAGDGSGDGDASED